MASKSKRETFDELVKRFLTPGSTFTFVESKDGILPGITPAFCEGTRTTLDKLSTEDMSNLQDRFILRGAASGWAVFDVFEGKGCWSTIRERSALNRPFCSHELQFASNHKPSFDLLTEGVIQDLIMIIDYERDEAIESWRASANVEYAINITIAAMNLIKEGKSQKSYYFTLDGPGYMPAVCETGTPWQDKKYVKEYNLYYMDHNEPIITEALRRIKNGNSIYPPLKRGDEVRVEGLFQHPFDGKVLYINRDAVLLYNGHVARWISRAYAKLITPSPEHKKSSKIPHEEYQDLLNRFSTTETTRSFILDKEEGIIRLTSGVDMPGGEGSSDKFLDQLCSNDMDLLVTRFLRRGAGSWVIYDYDEPFFKWKTAEWKTVEKETKWKWRSPTLQFATNNEPSFNRFTENVKKRLTEQYGCNTKEAIQRWRAKSNIEYAIDITVAAMNLIKKYKLEGPHYFTNSDPDYMPAVRALDSKPNLGVMKRLEEYNLYYFLDDAFIVEEAIRIIGVKDDNKDKKYCNKTDEKYCNKTDEKYCNKTDEKYCNKRNLEKKPDDGVGKEIIDLTTDSSDEKEQEQYSCQHIKDYPKAKYCPLCGMPAIRTQKWSKKQALQLLDHGAKLARLPTTILEQFLQIKDSDCKRYLNLDSTKPLGVESALSKTHCNREYQVCSSEMNKEDFISLINILTLVTPVFLPKPAGPTAEQQIAAIYAKGNVRASNRASVPADLRAKLLESSKGQCYCCGAGITKHFSELSHIIPHRHGGAVSEDNLVAACSACNKAMSSVNLFEWMLTTGKKGGIQCLEEEKNGKTYSGQTHDQWISRLVSLNKRAVKALESFKGRSQFSSACLGQIMDILADPARFSVEQREKVCDFTL